VSGQPQRKCSPGEKNGNWAPGKEKKTGGGGPGTENKKTEQKKGGRI